MLKWTLIGILFFTGCVIVPIPEKEFWGYEFEFPEAESIYNVTLAYSWVVRNLEYQKDGRNEWKTPMETFEDDGGDCEDLALFMAYLCYKYLGEYPYLATIKIDSGYHVVLIIRCVVYDPKGPIVTGDAGKIEADIYHLRNYGQAMYKALFER